MYSQGCGGSSPFDGTKGFRSVRVPRGARDFFAFGRIPWRPDYSGLEITTRTTRVSSCARRDSRGGVSPHCSAPLFYIAYWLLILRCGLRRGSGAQAVRIEDEGFHFCFGALGGNFFSVPLEIQAGGVAGLHHDFAGGAN
jgi:hypothetical protein